MSDKITVRLSHETRLALEIAREASGNTITGEVEAQLRHALKVESVYRHDLPSLILLKVDDGMMAWLTAIYRMHFFGISFEDTVLYMLRCEMIRQTDHDCWFPHIVDELPEPYRSRLQATRRYEVMKEHNENSRARGHAVWPFSPPKRKDARA